MLGDLTFARLFAQCGLWDNHNFVDEDVVVRLPGKI